MTTEMLAEIDQANLKPKKKRAKKTIKSLTEQLEILINIKVNEFIELTNEIDQLEVTASEEEQDYHFLAIMGIAQDLECVLYIIEAHNKPVADAIKMFLELGKR